MTRLVVWLLCIFLVSACSTGGTVSHAASPALPATVSASSDALPSTPGLVIRGRVRLSDGTGLANVVICRNFASYPGSVAARTDSSGNFNSAFVAIPGDEMIGVWPLLAGYTFEPKLVSWRHYYGYEEKMLDFVAVPTLATDIPPTACSLESNISPSITALPSPTVQCRQELVPPQIMEIQPAAPAPGSKVEVTGFGGYTRDNCGGVNESAKVFELYLDQELAGDLLCYVNRCEGKITLPETMSSLSHCLSTEKDGCEFEFKVSPD